MRKLILTSLLTIIAISISFSQRYFDERYIFNQAFIHPTLINPGAYGYTENQNLLISYRNNWATFEGSPKTVSLGYDGLLVNKLGMGIQFLQDNFGALQTTKGVLGFSYQISSDINKLGFGLSAEYIKHGLNNFNVSSSLNVPDALINARREGIQYIDATFGIYGIYNNQFTYGISLPSLISSRIDETNFDEKRDLGFILNLGYKVTSVPTGISLEPSVLLKKLNNVPTHVDLNLKLGFLDEKLIGGVGYTVGAEEKLAFLLGLNIERIGFYYSYNVSSKDFQDYNNGAHELSAKIRIGSKKVEMVENK
jgi:type IX secretion system PorP/SprF family membrane protein